jgi:hypothetical protein
MSNRIGPRSSIDLCATCLFRFGGGQGSSGDPWVFPTIARSLLLYARLTRLRLTEHQDFDWLVFMRGMLTMLRWETYDVEHYGHLTKRDSVRLSNDAILKTAPVITSARS